MSGICGVVNFDGAPVDPNRLQSIAESAPYRSDGGIEYWIHGPIGLASLASRLSATSASGFCVDGRLAVVADARLDNRAELAHQLATTGCQPTGTPSDLELILAAFACWGPACGERLQGAYSLACWNEADASLVLLRDRLGERSLYWCTVEQSVFFASEPAQLLSLQSIDPAPNLERSLAYLLKQPFDPTWSFFRNIQRLPESHYLVCKDHQTTLQRYWSAHSVTPQAWPRSEAAEALSVTLEQAVARRLREDRASGNLPSGILPSGVLLSSGLDSSSVAAKASGILERQGKHLFAFTWESRSGDKLDEREWSTSLIEARPNILERAVLADERYPLSRYPEAYADPNAPNTNTYPDLLLATIEVARQEGVQVLMNGMGGDLVVGGVLPELALLRQGRWGVLAQRLRRSGRGGLRSLYRQIRQAVKTQLPAWIATDGRRLARQADLDRPASWTREIKSPLSLRTHLVAQSLNAMDLERFDRLSARHGVRIAAPWYDAGLVSLVLSMPDGGLDEYPPGKSLLRQAMAGQLPETLLSRPVPKDRVASLAADGLVRHGRNQIANLLRHSILGQVGLIDPPTLLAAYQQAAKSGRLIPGIWEVITLEIWLQIHYNRATLLSR